MVELLVTGFVCLTHCVYLTYRNPDCVSSSRKRLGRLVIAIAGLHARTVIAGVQFFFASFLASF